MEGTINDIKIILTNERIAYLATSNGKYSDNAVIAFVCDDELNIFFGSFSDTLKCKNIDINPYVAVAVSTLQIHGLARKITYGSEEYNNKLVVYNKKFPQYAHVFEKENNELYVIEPLIVWNYNPSKGEMYRDKIIFSQNYYDDLKPYEAPIVFEERKK